MYFALVAVFALLLLAVLPTDGAKAQKAAKKQKGTQQGTDLDCECCHAVIEQLQLRLAKSLPVAKGSTRKYARSTAVLEALESVCDQKSFPSYKFAPPKMRQACLQLLGEREDELEELLLVTDGSISADGFCAKPCRGIDRSAPLSYEPSVEIIGD